MIFSPVAEKTAVFNLTEGDLIALAGDIAQDLLDHDQMLERYKLTQEQFDLLRVNTFFTNLVDSEKTAWHAVTNAADRAKLKAALLVERSLPEMYLRITSGKEELEASIKGFQALMKVAGIGERPIGPAGGGPTDHGDKFVISINLGGGHEMTYTKERAISDPKTIDAIPADVAAVADRLNVVLDKPRNFFLDGDGAA